MITLFYFAFSLGARPDEVVEAEANVRAARNVLFFLDTDTYSTQDKEQLLYKDRIDLKTQFGNDNPVFLEICSGHGDWVVGRAKQDNSINWLSLEMRFDRCHQIWLKARLAQVHNLCVLHGEASKTVNDHVYAGSLDRVFINHPDPPNWENNKERLITKEFLISIHNALKENSQLVIVTDDAEYAATISSVFESDEVSCLYTSSYAPQTFSMVLPENWGSSYFDRFFNARKQYDRFYFEMTKVEGPVNSNESD